MDKKKLKLSQVTINSFITNLEQSDKQTIKGGMNEKLQEKISDINESSIWTLIRIVGVCQTTRSRNNISNLDRELCPACARPKAENQAIINEQ